MYCKVCDKDSDETVFCDDCSKQLATHIGVKCLACGAFGFIDPTVENIKRLEFFIPSIEGKLLLCDVCVIPMNGCPNCIDYEKINFGGFTA